MQKMNMRFCQHKGSEELMLLIIYEPRTHLIEVGRQRIVAFYAKQHDFLSQLYHKAIIKHQRGHFACFSPSER